MVKHNRFKPGQSTFKCEICERMTRDTGQGVDHLCELCYNIAGWDNHVNDNGYKPGDTGHEAALTHVHGDLDKIAKLGGNVQEVLSQNEYLWPDGVDHRAASPSAGKTRATVTKERQMARNRSNEITETVTYRFNNETPGAWRYDAVIPKGKRRLPAGSNVIYFTKEDYPDCPEDEIEVVIGPFTIPSGGKPAKSTPNKRDDDRDERRGRSRARDEDEEPPRGRGGRYEDDDYDDAPRGRGRR